MKHPRRSQCIDVLAFASQIGLVVLVVLAGCSDSTGSCIDIDSACTPLYEPTFQNVFDNTLRPRCGVGGSTCHSAQAAQGGLIFADVDQSYNLLVGARRVEPENPGCSLLLERIAASDSARVMPPGNPLEASEICSIEKWVTMGASR